jgi:hypothetical protein
VVDLESALYAGAAAAVGVPWLILRAVSDAAHEAVPALLNACLDADGALARTRVLRALAREPRALPALLRLRRRVQGCAVHLGAAVERILGACAAPAAGSNRLTLGWRTS